MAKTLNTNFGQKRTGQNWPAKTRQPKTDWPKTDWPKSVMTLQTPPKFNERTSERGRKKENCGGRGKKERNVGRSWGGRIRRRGGPGEQPNLGRTHENLEHTPHTTHPPQHQNNTTTPTTTQKLKKRRKKARTFGGPAEGVRGWGSNAIGSLFGQIGQIPKSSSIGQGWAKWFATRFDQSGPKGGPKSGLGQKSTGQRSLSDAQDKQLTQYLLVPR